RAVIWSRCWTRIQPRPILAALNAHSEPVAARCASARVVFLALLVLLPWDALAQEQPADVKPGARTPQAATGQYVPITGRERVQWIVSGTVGPRSLGVGGLAATWQTGFNIPREWGSSPAGFGKRYLHREADVTISNAIEAGLGALWHEEPRYVPSARRGFMPR